MPKQLWPHQVRTIAAVDAAIAQGRRKPLIVVPTGGGKSCLAATIAATHVRNGGKVLWLAHRSELWRQGYATLKEQGLDVGVIAAGQSGQHVNPHRPVQIASIQTLLARNIRPPATLLINDEAHHSAVGNEWATILRDYATSIIIGLSATPARADDAPLEGFDNIIVGATIKELTDAGVLVPCDVIRPHKNLGSKKIAQSPLVAYNQFCKGMKTIIFAQNSKAALEYLTQFGAEAKYVNFKSPNREQIFAEHRAGKFPVLINLNLASEGYDDPSLSCCILARTCGSTSLYLQIVGRVLRASPGKERATLVDLTGASHVHGMPDEEREYSLEGKGIRRAGEVLPYSFCRVCSAVIGPSDLVCLECGTEREVATPPEITNDPLVKFARVRKRNETERKAHYFRMLDEAKKAGHKTGKAYWRFKSTYDAEPPFAWLREWSANRG